jgi:hypothetical protein
MLDGADDLTGRGVDRVEGLARSGVLVAAINKEVLLGQLHDRER